MEQQKPDREFLAPLERIGEGLVIFGMLLLAGFFYANQALRTGFFTHRLGIFEMVCLYGPIAVFIIPSVIRIITGRRNPARLYDAAASLILAAGSLRLIMVFPFDFTHFTDVFPGFMKFMFAWFTDSLAMIPLYLQVIIGPISAIAKAWQYFMVREREHAHLPLQPAA
jgi:hypothetical protein